MFYLKDSSIHGIGCFTDCPIPKGTLIDVPVLVIDYELGKQLHPHVFPWFADIKQCIVLNEFTYCNSSTTPNLRIKSIDRDKLIKTFITLRYIEQDEEIFLKYLKTNNND